MLAKHGGRANSIAENFDGAMGRVDANDRAVDLVTDR
jgi:hypothetical protein